MLYAALFFYNLFSSEQYISPIAFWFQGLFYYIYLLYCLGSYRDRRELCFYCQYEMVQGALHCIYAFFFATENYQWAFVTVVVVIFGCMMVARIAAKEEREEERIR